MVHPISHAAQAHDSAQTAAAVRQSPPQPAQPQPTHTDTVHLSQAALASRAVSQEATETPAQTVREAANGDVQARHLVARQAASRKG